jgi:hypothetical protein
MIVVQASRGRLNLLALVGHAVVGAAAVGIIAATIFVPISHPCQDRQRIWTAGFSLGDHCLR